MHKLQCADAVAYGNALHTPTLDGVNARLEHYASRTADFIRVIDANGRNALFTLAVAGKVIERRQAQFQTKGNH